MSQAAMPHHGDMLSLNTIEKEGGGALSLVVNPTYIHTHTHTHSSLSHSCEPLAMPWKCDCNIWLLVAFEQVYCQKIHV